MSTQILTTKLYIPPSRHQSVKRARLIERLNDGFDRKLILVAAPAGFGKTTLVSEWIAQLDCPVAWLSLDENDSDESRFLAYVIATLQTIEPQIGETLSEALQSPQFPSIEQLLTTLLNDTATLSDDFLLILDDYHFIENAIIDQAITFLLDYLPPHMHLVIITREDPPLPLSRLRVRGQLTEIRASDLRFSIDEAGKFFNEGMGLQLSEQDITTLEARTEGWIAGLQLAALSIQGQTDVHGFITAFAGDNRYIVDYLVDEVLQHQPEHLRSYLLQTSIIDRLCGDLCNALTSYRDSAILLDELERSNLFVIPLDDKRMWFRYHHLFADVLRAHLNMETPDLVPTLHRRASEWYMQNGFTAEAVRHAFLAEDFQRAAYIIEVTWAEMDRTRQFAPWLKWARTLPDEYIRARPVLSVGYAWALLENGELENGENRLSDAEKLFESASADMIIHDEEEFEFLHASIANARAYLSQAHNDIPATIYYAQQALDLLPMDDYLRRGVTGSLLGLALWVRGDLRTAYESFASAMTSFEMAGNIMFAITGVYILSDMLLTLGQLRDAMATYRQALQLAKAQGEPPIQGTADLYLGLSELYHEQFNVDLAQQYLLKSEELSEATGFQRWTYRWSFVQARLKQAQGDFDDALHMLHEAERLYIRGPVPDMRPISALKANIWIKQGELSKAFFWADEQDLSVDDDLSYPREFEHLVFVRLLIARYKSGENPAIDDALTLLSRLLKQAENGKRNGSSIEILIQQALAYEAQGNISQALMPLERALTLAEPEGFVRLFTDEGTPMQRLLSRMAKQEFAIAYVYKLLSVYDAGESLSTDNTATEQQLIEPLSDRELEVLQLVADGLSNREISERLYIALSTVKGHNRNIYGKLGVERRTEAIARARELGLLE